ncbi:MAG: ribosome small subunit-dependent GTPase A [Christensenellaceae bacterium]
MIIFGRIVKGISGFYYVNDEQGVLHECKACGRFRNENIIPLVGDQVEFSVLDGYDFIENILPRKNQLIRPAVANIDMMILVVSAAKPTIDFVLCDKLLIQAEKNNINCVLAINKNDVDFNDAQQISDQYSYYNTVNISALTGEGIEDLKDYVRGNCVCFAGQSAVGKSSIINAFGAGLELETGTMSKKTQRGKHTTRQAELMFIPDLKAYVVDTPGFSMFDITELKKEEIGQYFREFAQCAGECRFHTCMHDQEPDCAVKYAVEQGNISKERYERYLKMIHDEKLNHPQY